MKVILNQDVKGQGKKGQLVEVSDGYARNYLIPRKLAVLANDANIKEMNVRDKAKDDKAQRDKQKAKEALERLQATSVKIKVKCGAGGRLFGSVTTKEISDALMDQFGVAVEKSKLAIAEPIKVCGTYEVKAKMYQDVQGCFFVVIME